MQELQEVSFLAQELYAEANEDSLSNSFNGGIGLIQETDPSQINYMMSMMGNMNQVFNTDNPFEDNTAKPKEKPAKQKTYRYHAYVPKSKRQKGIKRQS